LRNKNRDLSDEDISKFIGYDLHDNFNVVIEAGSNIPKLQSAEKANLLQLAQVGSLNLDSPQNRLEFNKRMGVVGFDTEVGPDVKRAEWENSVLEDPANVLFGQLFVLADENHAIHKEIHTNRMKEPSFYNLPQEVQQAYLEHNAKHDEQLEMMKSLALQESMATGQPAQMPGLQDEPLRAHGKGISQAMQAQVLGQDGSKLQ